MATERQILANRLNAARSTGPRTAEGKDITRANALKQGLAARSLLPAQDAEAAAERTRQWNSSLKPNNVWELWLVERIAVESLRVDRCTREESALRDSLALRAESCWDDDRRAEAEALARKLDRDPASVRAGLESTRFGCEWLIARWGELLAAFVAGGGWDDGQAGRARDLLNLPGDVPATEDAARSELERLKFKLDRDLMPLDEAARALAESGMGPDPTGEIRRVRRYETSCLRRLEWAWSQLKKGRRDVPDPDSKPAGHAESPDDFEEYGENSYTGFAAASKPFPEDWRPIGETAATTAVSATGRFSLAGAVADQARGPQPTGNRRERRAARRRR